MAAKPLGMPIIIAAPSGAGKTSLVAELIKTVANLQVSISHTTRPQRPGEQDGVNYHFVTTEVFETLVKQQQFLEYAKVFGHYYGTSLSWVQSQLQGGTHVIFEIDWQGAKQIRQRLPDAFSIFILPPSHDVLRQRLQRRGQDDAKVIAKRMAKAHEEISHYQEFDYLVINDDFSQAQKELVAIITAEGLRQAKQQQRLEPLLANLLA